MFIKSICGFILTSFTIINAHSQDQESRVFIDNFFGQSAKLVYLNKLSENEIEDMQNALAQDTLYKLGAKLDELNDRLLLTPRERSYVQNELTQLFKLAWTDELFKNGKVLTIAVVDSIFKDQTRSWMYFEAHYGSRLYSFSKPIFLRDHSLCIFYSGYTCGPRCGQGKLMVFKKKNSTWIAWMDLFRWES